jgi:exo-beta-1,3-glucanase (GH17 family)
MRTRLVALAAVWMACALPATAQLLSLEKSFNEDRWAAYSPTNYNPDQGVYPTEDSIRQDLDLLVAIGFRGICTYGATNVMGQVPRIAKEAGIRKVVMGIWDIYSAEEWQNALIAAPYVDAYCVGNEGLNSNPIRYTRAQLAQQMACYRFATGKPVTTSEIYAYYDAQLIDMGDWFFPIVHPWWNNRRDPAAAVAWTQERYNQLVDNSRGHFVVLKETGLPTGGDPAASAWNQAVFYHGINSARVRFLYFEAFDSYWKTAFPFEPYWGLFDRYRVPKVFTSLPQIWHEYVPRYKRWGDYLWGGVVGADPALYKVAVYITVPEFGWIIKPHYDTLTPIGPGGFWYALTTTGGRDNEAIEFASFLVPPDYSPPPYQPPFYTYPVVYVKRWGLSSRITNQGYLRVDTAATTTPSGLLVWDYTTGAATYDVRYGRFLSPFRMPGGWGAYVGAYVYNYESQNWVDSMLGSNPNAFLDYLVAFAGLAPSTSGFSTTQYVAIDADAPQVLSAVLTEYHGAGVNAVDYQYGSFLSAYRKPAANEWVGIYLYNFEIGGFYTLMIVYGA